MSITATRVGRITLPPQNTTLHRYPCPRCGIRRTVKRDQPQHRLCADCQATDPTWPHINPEENQPA